MNREPDSARLGILLIDDSRSVLAVLTELIAPVNDMQVVGTASTGQDGVRRAVELEPDVVLLDLNLPDIDGLEVASTISSRVPNTSIIMVTSEAKPETIQRAMLAGAQGYITKPFSQDAVLQTIRSVRAKHLERVSRIGATARPAGVRPPSPHPAAAVSVRRGRRIVVFGAKGGVGKTLVAANLAVALKTRTGKKVALLDADFTFGDLDLHLNITSRNTILDLVPRVADLDSDLLDQMMVSHESGVMVMLGPKRPEEAELIKAELFGRLLTTLPTFYDYSVVDCQHGYDDKMLSAVDHADLILLVLVPEMGPIRNTKHFLRLADTLGFSRDKILLILNRSDSDVGLSPANVEAALGMQGILELPSGGRAVVTAVNEGTPIVLTNPRHPLSKAILEIARRVEAKLSDQP